MRLTSVIAFPLLLCLAGSAARAQELKPLSPADAARVASLLSKFDTNSYALKYQVAKAPGKVVTHDIGLEGVTQRHKLVASPALKSASTVNTINVFANRAASTVNTINVFRQRSASSVNTINVFTSKEASTVNTINVFRTQAQKEAAVELDKILARYLD